MAYDIGPRIGIDGEREFRQQLQSVGIQLKTLSSEMKVVTTSFEGNEDSMEALTAKNEVLTKTINALNDKISQQRKFLDASKEKFGDNADETQKWQRAINESQAELNRLENQLKQNEGKLEDLQKELSQNTTQFGRWARQAEDAGDSLDDAGGSVMKFGDALKASFVGNVGANIVSGLFDKLVELGGAIVNLDEETAEYRAEQAMLLSSFEANGHGADTAKAAYSGLFRVIGDSDEATEASQLLGNLAGGTEDIDKWTRIAAGSWGKFGKSLPITNLIEAANEAAKTGKSVSALDDAINWSGGDAEAFAENLANAATEEERLSLITETLTLYLSDSADAFYANNEQIIKARDSEMLMAETTAKLGETVGDIKNRLLNDFAPSISSAGNAFNEMLKGTEGADEQFAQAIDDLIKKGGEKASSFIDVGGDFFVNMLNGLTDESDSDTVSIAVSGIIQSLIDTITDHAGEITVGGLILMAEILTGLLDGLVGIDEDASEMAENIKQAFINNKDKLKEAGTELAKALWEGLSSLTQLITGHDEFGRPWYDPLYNTGTPLKPSRQATGLYTVPYDGFLASLHEGEMVLTRKQAEMIRANGITNTSMQNAVAAMVNGMQSAPGMTADTPVNITLVTPDGDTLGRWLLPSLIRVADADGTPITAL